MQKNENAIIYDYSTNVLKPYKSIPLTNEGDFVSTEDKETIILNNAFYLINDDTIINSDESNMGSIIVVTDDTGDVNDDSIVIDNDGNIISGGEIGSDGNMRPPLFVNGDGVNVFFNSIITGISDLFTNITDGFSKIVESCNGFFGFLGSAFSFVPTEFWTIVILGMSVVVILRIFGR